MAKVSMVLGRLVHYGEGHEQGVTDVGYSILDN
jgi:hypothetical protein